MLVPVVNRFTVMVSACPQYPVVELTLNALGGPDPIDTGGVAGVDARSNAEPSIGSTEDT